MEAGETNGGVKACSASSRASLAGETLLVEEVSNIASRAGGLIASESILVESANTATSRAENAESIGQHKSSQTVDAHGVSP